MKKSEDDSSSVKARLGFFPKEKMLVLRATTLKNSVVVWAIGRVTPLLNSRCKLKKGKAEKASDRIYRKKSSKYNKKITSANCIRAFVCVCFRKTEGNRRRQNTFFLYIKEKKYHGIRQGTQLSKQNKKKACERLRVY
jgi:hypothetical protein